MTTVADAYTQRRTFPPFASNDSSLLLNLYPVITADNLTAAGLPVAGSGSSFDANLGFKPGFSGFVRKTSWLTAQDASQGTIMLEVEREGIAIDKTMSSGSSFYNSTGLPSATAGGLGDRYFFGIVQTNPTTNLLRLFMTATGALVFQHYVGGVDGTQNTIISRPNSYAPSWRDSRFVQLVVTWKGTQLWIYYDGIPVYQRTLLGTWAAGFFNELTIGRYDNTGTIFGDYFIRSCQISTKYCGPVSGGPKVALYGDSFVVAGTNRSDPADTVAAIDAAQTSATPLQLAAGAGGNIRGQNVWMNLIAGRLNLDYGFILPVYNGAKSGRGWAASGNPIPAAYATAINAWRPEILIAFGSVNDVPTDAATTLVANIKSALDGFVNNNPILRKIIFVETVSWEASTAGPASLGISASAYLQRYQNQIAAMRQELPNYEAGTRGVKVKYVRTYGEIYQSGNVDPKRLFIGSHPDNTTTSADGGAAQDAHPTAEGAIKIAELVSAALMPEMLTRPKKS
jgi:hypothetical protein